MPGTSARAPRPTTPATWTGSRPRSPSWQRPPGPVHAETATRLASCRVNRASLSGDVSEMRRAAAAVDAAAGAVRPVARPVLSAGGRRSEAAPARRGGGEPCDGPKGSPTPPTAGRSGRTSTFQLGRYRGGAPGLRAARRRDTLVGRTRAPGALRAGARRSRAGPRALRRRRRRDHRQGASLLRVGRDALGPPAPAPRPARRGGAALRARGGCVLGPLARREARRGPPGRAGPPRRGDRHRRGRRAARSARPELAHAAGDLLRRAGEAPTRRGPGTCGRWPGTSSRPASGRCSTTTTSAEHYADVEGDGAAAVLWAERDRELRPHYATEAALAWALHRAGRHDEALEAAHRTLASGVQRPARSREDHRDRSASADAHG